MLRLKKLKIFENTVKLIPTLSKALASHMCPDEIKPKTFLVHGMTL